MELEWLYDEVQMYSFLKKHCEEKGFINALRSLDYAMIQHEGQIRKGNGAPYVTHPMAVAFFMILCGMDKDEAISIALLHDVPEDCNTDLHDLNVESNIKHSANILNWKQYKYRYDNRKIAMWLYYTGISADKWASLVKFGDRAHNLSTMAGAFTPLKMIDYVKETKTYYPYLFQCAYCNFPEVRSSIHFLQSRILELVKVYETNDFSNPESGFDQKVIDIFNNEMYIPEQKIIVLPKQENYTRKKIIIA